MTLIKKLSGGYINIDYITDLVTYEDKYWCKLLGQSDWILISAETYNKLIEKYGKI